MDENKTKRWRRDWHRSKSSSQGRHHAYGRRTDRGQRSAGGFDRLSRDDMGLGVGGLPRGRVVEIYGPESSGKTTLCLHIVAQIQTAGGVAAYIDVKTHSIRFMPANSA